MSDAKRVQPPIADYAFISDCQSGALVDRSGSVDWWCVPRFDSPSVFGRLLDASAGHFSIRPVEDFEVSREYLEDSLVLRTEFRTATATIALTDAGAFKHGARDHDIGLESPHVLLRCVEVVSGSAEIELAFAPRMEYGRTEPHLTGVEGGVRARGGPTQLTLICAATFTCANGVATARVTLHAGDRLDMSVAYQPTYGPAPSRHPRPAATLDDTLHGWQSWAALHQSYSGPHAALVRRSSVVLQGLTYQPSGAIVAAATTSLPETMGGDLNWDYRYAWLRDFSLTIRSLWIAACPAEPSRLVDWFVNAAGRVGDELFQIMYGVEGERDLTERSLDHLAGYCGSTPVRVGNEAWKQVQLDVLGEVVDAVHLLRDDIGAFDESLQRLIIVLADRAAAQWEQPDAGMWESRDDPRHYVSSKIMCWLALDRAIDLGERLGAGADIEHWTAVRADIHAAVLDRAWSNSAESFAGAFDSDELDASVLLMPLVGFLPGTDSRVRATVEAIERELTHGGLVRRWREDDSGFIICTFWLAESMALIGQSDRAHHWFDSAAGYANEVGLMSEEAVPDGGPLLGNFPQAFSHVGLINAAWRLDSMTSGVEPDQGSRPMPAHP